LPVLKDIDILGVENNKQLAFSFWQEMLRVARFCQMPLANGQQHKFKNQIV
jgi:hypothetical protein